MRNFLAIATTIFLASCSNNSNTLFESLSPTATGIGFANQPSNANGINFLDYLYYYNGGGVAAGDINNDGLIDLYFTANNKGGNKLYLNKGQFKFEDITEKAAVAGTADWNTGVTMADVNGDGFLDIYVSVVSGKLGLSGRNQLFINNGNGTFTDKAKEYGLDIESYGTQAAFFDLDHDGDLDCFLLTQSDHSVERFADTSLRRQASAKAGDRLFRNDGNLFTDISAEAGIYSSVLGYGLGLAVADLDGDGCEDIYVGNDFHENDYYYHNNGNGTFTEEGSLHFSHYSRFSMGNDIADFNNDAAPDIMTVDMLPEDEKYLKTYSSGESLDTYRFTIDRNGYQTQYSRNVLQQNLGGGKAFSDVALLQGVAATDWSWSPLFADFDNDGWKDLFISNGIKYRPVDLDYMRFLSGTFIQKNMQESRQLDSQALAQMPDGAAHNYLFRNKKGRGFDDISLTAGFEQPGYSSGAVYADLDNNGSLDLVTTNSFAPAGIYRNTNTAGHWLQLALKDSSSGNKMAIGAKVWLWQNGQMQYQQLMLTRGFQSSVAARLHFGLEMADSIEKIRILWPDQTVQEIRSVKPDQILEVRKAGQPKPATISPNPKLAFTDISDSFSIGWTHKENSFTDFSSQRLIPHQLSDRGPKMAVADINGDGYDDIYFCAAAQQQGALLLSTKDGQWKSNLLPPDRDLSIDEVAACWVDVNADGRPDLYIASGGNEKWPGDSSLTDRLYLQSNTGSFSRSFNIPPIAENKSTAIAADIDGDGDQDIFIGVLADARAYGVPCDSYLLLNDGKGNFSKAADDYIDLKALGMVTSASFGDIDGDGKVDLLVAGEWMPVTVFLNKGTFFRKTIIAATAGLWQCLQVADIDADGDLDLLAGNYGRNSKLQASVQQPLRLYVKDFDQNGKIDQLLSYRKKGVEYPFLGKDELEMQLPMIKKKFLHYRDFAGKPLTEIAGNWLDGLKPMEVQTLATTLFRNNGKGKFKAEELPMEAQLSPSFSLLPADLNADGKTDIITAGNFYGVSPYEGRYDANWGFILLGGEKNSFHAWSPVASGFINRGETRDLKKVRTANGELYIAALNDAKPRIFRTEIKSSSNVGY